jgi:hypothetical protein
MKYIPLLTLLFICTFAQTSFGHGQPVYIDCRIGMFFTEGANGTKLGSGEFSLDNAKPMSVERACNIRVEFVGKDHRFPHLTLH